MAIIAVAGGLGQVGRALVDGLVQHGHKVLVLTRKASETSNAFTIVTADYDDVEATARLLQDNKVDTLMCAIGVLNERSNRSQLNLVKAAAQSAFTHRFVIGSYDMKHLREQIPFSPLAKYTFEAVDALDETNLEYTRIVNGWFLDYFGMPHWKTSLHPWINILSMKDKWAVVPGDGTASATFITTQDLGRFIGRLMDAPEWDKESTVVGNEMQFNKLVALAEETRGCKFEVAYDSLEKLRAGKISFADRFPQIGMGTAADDEAFFALVHYLAGSGNFVVAPGRRTLNEQFPEIQLTTCEEVMQTAWQGRT